MTASSSLAFRSCCNEMALLKSVASAWAGQPFKAYKQDFKTFRDRETTVKYTSLLKRWGRYSRVISCSIKNIWTAWKLDVPSQLQIGQHLLKLKMIGQKSFSQTVALKLHSLLLRNSEVCDDGYFLKLRNFLRNTHLENIREIKLCSLIQKDVSHALIPH